MLTDELCCVNLNVPTGERDRVEMLENVVCVQYENIQVCQTYQRCFEKLEKKFSLDVQPV